MNPRLDPQALGPYEAGNEVQFEVDIVDDQGEPPDLQNISPHFYLARDAATAPAASTDSTPQTAVAAFGSDPQDPPKMVVNVASAVTAALLGTYEWRCELMDATNERQLVARGYVTFFASLKTT